MADRKPTVKKETGTVKKAAKPELKQFLGDIEKRAYEIYQERKKSGAPGNEMSDWLAAENEVKAKYKI